MFLPLDGPAIVRVNLFVRSIATISDIKMVSIRHKNASQTKRLLKPQHRRRERRFSLAGDYSLSLFVCHLQEERKVEAQKRKQVGFRVYI